MKPFRERVCEHHSNLVRLPRLWLRRAYDVENADAKPAAGAGGRRKEDKDRERYRDREGEKESEGDARWWRCGRLHEIGDSQITTNVGQSITGGAAAAEEEEKEAATAEAAAAETATEAAAATALTQEEEAAIEAAESAETLGRHWEKLMLPLRWRKNYKHEGNFPGIEFILTPRNEEPPILMLIYIKALMYCINLSDDYNWKYQ